MAAMRLGSTMPFGRSWLSIIALRIFLKSGNFTGFASS